MAFMAFLELPKPAFVSRRWDAMARVERPDLPRPGPARMLQDLTHCLGRDGIL